jgi:hypothetical protein
MGKKGIKAMKILRDILTGSDNVSYDCGRVLYFASHVAYFAMGFVSYLSDRPWGPMDFASGISTMAVAFGIHMYMKKDSEPHA